MIEITQNEYRELVQLYKKAVANGESTFMFQERVMLTSYVKYLIEYLGER